MNRVAIDKAKVLMGAMSKVKSELVKLNALKATMIQDAYTDEVREALDAIDAELDPRIASMTGALSSAEKSVKEAVITNGATIDNAYGKGIFYNGRDKWNTKKLLSLMDRVPEIAECYTQGDPYASVRLK